MIQNRHDLQAMGDAIKGLYADNGVGAPTAADPIAPLSLIINHQNLVSKELPHLTAAEASRFLLKKGGAVASFATTTTDDLAGFLYVTRNYGCVFVERDDALVRRRFSAAHELGHYVLHFRPALQHLPDEDSVMLDAFLQTPSDVAPDQMPLGKLAIPPTGLLNRDEAELEREANAFAAELLMPAPVVYDLLNRYERYFEGDDLVRRLAGTLLVSHSAMHWRLRHLGALAEDLARLN